jgi:L-alanine-DL-glutamate epimerase-like enolase superfamily enzyme
VTKREDYEAYLERAAELDRRIATGESIMDIMRAEQLARGQALIARALELDAQDGTEWE